MEVHGKSVNLGEIFDDLDQISASYGDEQPPAPPSPYGRCENCFQAEFIHDPHRGELICAHCGLVREERMIDPGKEWRSFAGEPETRCRVGAPLTELIPDRGLSTKIGRATREVRGHLRPKLARLRKWQARVHRPANTSLPHALDMIDKMASQLHLTRVVREAAAKFYRQVTAAHMTRGHSLEELATGCLFLACRRCRVPRTLSEVAAVANLRDYSRKRLAAVVRYLVKGLNVTVRPTNPFQFVPKLVSDLDLSRECLELTRILLTHACKKGLDNGRNPLSIAAGALYLASVILKEAVLQKDIARAAGVTVVALRDRFYELDEDLHLNKARRRNSKRRKKTRPAVTCARNPEVD